jgi:hypothetical protein
LHLSLDNLDKLNVDTVERDDKDSGSPGKKFS